MCGCGHHEAHHHHPKHPHHHSSHRCCCCHGHGMGFAGFTHHYGLTPYPKWGGMFFVPRRKRLRHLEEMREMLSEWLDEVEQQIATLKEKRHHKNSEDD